MPTLYSAAAALAVARDVLRLASLGRKHALHARYDL